jgi:ATP-dependent RNA helicase RhlE
VPKTVRALVLAPTRELAAQIAESFRVYGRFANIRVGCVVGGVSPGPQIRSLAGGLDVLVATPGRLLDHMGGGAVRLDATEVVVLDEADHMLDLGFVLPIRRILAKLPKTRQSLFFSATMPREIAGLAAEMLHRPVEVSVAPVATTAERIAQQVYLVEAAGKLGLLTELLRKPDFSRSIVFTRTKRGADRVAKSLDSAGLGAVAIHGNKSQNQRQRALDDFRKGHTPVLVATDIAARGIDVDGISHVVNFDLPDVPEAYVHRIGRTARAGAAGIAISLCDSSERSLLRSIEKLTRQSIPTTDRRSHSSAAADAQAAAAPPAGAQRPQHRGQRPGGNHHAPNNGPRGPNEARPAGQQQRRRHRSRPAYKGQAETRA